MNDLISRQAVLDWLKNEWNGMVTSLFDGIKALPSAQPDIIRCGECRHLHDNDCPVVGWGRDDDDYCAWAERDNDE